MQKFCSEFRTVSDIVPEADNSRSFDNASRDETARGSAQDDTFVLGVSISGLSISEPPRSGAALGCAGSCGLEEVDGEDEHDGFEGTAEARLNRDEIIGDGEKREGPGEEDCCGDSAREGEDQAEDSSEREKAVVEDAEGLVPYSVFDGVGDADPVEVETL